MATVGKLGISGTETAMRRLYETVDAGLIEVVKQPSGEPYADRAPRYYRIIVSSKETKELIKTGQMLRVFPAADEVADKIFRGTHPPPNSRTAEQRPEKKQNSEQNQSITAVRGGSNRDPNSAQKAEQRAKTAEFDPEDLPIEDDVGNVDHAHVNADHVYSPSGRVNMVNNSSETTKETPKPADEITLGELDRKMRDAGVDMDGPLWRGKI
jgi:hypothetical protein